MNSVFGRAVIGFIALTGGLAGMTMFAFWAVNVFGGAAWWAGLLIAIIALAAEISVYANTLHDPIRDWIKEPAELKREAQASYWWRDHVSEAIAKHLRECHSSVAGKAH